MDPARDLERLAGRLDETVVVVGWPDERLYARVPGVSTWSPAQLFSADPSYLFEVAVYFGMTNVLILGIGFSACVLSKFNRSS